MPQRPPRIAVLYHYFHPDDVVSARHFGDLAEGLSARGWEVEALPSNRGCRDESRCYPPNESWHGVTIHRVWRPPLRQASTLGRIANALWMIGAWSRLAFRRGKRQPDVVLMGTDPILSVLVAGLVRSLNPRLGLAHWAFDLYPEAAVADGLLAADSLLPRLLRPWLRRSYQACDLIADLGPRMRQLLAAYGPQGQAATLVPWALAEPPQAAIADPTLRRQLFGEAKLAVMYSGNFGRAHSYDEFLSLARALRGSGIEFGFAIRGNRAAEVQAAVTADDTNVRFLPFAAEADLERHLAAADIHLASLRPHWSGIVVPSKFFGSLATGRPVLFAGEATSDLALCIKDESVGWTLSKDSQSAIAAELRQLADDAKRLRDLQIHCHAVYHRRFRREHVLDQFDLELRRVLQRKKRRRA